jgi:DNA replication protein DnaC
MADCFDSIAADPDLARLPATDVVKMTVDWEWERRRDSKLARLRRRAHLPQPNANVHDIQMLPGRRVDTDMIARLAVGAYLAQHQDVVLQGPTGAGKTYLACALGNAACQQYHTVSYLTAADLFDQLGVAEHAGTKTQVLDALVKVDLLIVDDWFLTAPTRDQARNLHVLVDRRHRHASTLYCTQLGPDQWHDRIEEKILADAIIDRITTNAHTITLDCDDSLRRHFNGME